MSQVTPCQNVPVQTSQYNFPTCQQRQTSTQQMQTAACGPGVSQGPFVYQPDTCVVTHQYTPGTSQPIANPCHPVFQGIPCNPAPAHPSCGQLPQNVLDQIRACVSNAAPIFILPGGCQQSSQQQQPPASMLVSPQAMAPPAPPTTAYPPSGLTYPAACYPPPPSFYPYPVPLPFCDSFIRRGTAREDCGCCRKRDVEPPEMRSIVRAGCYDAEMVDGHRCTPTTDDTICSKRSCPSSLHLQALASQFLSMQGIISCAATRLVLRKVPGSNVTTTMEDTMAKAQKAMSALTKDQLLTESRNAQQVNALINLHMTANPPPNIIPILTLVQLKINLLKAQVEGLVNQKLMEIQGVGVEVETDLIDPTVLALKSDAELRDFLSVLRQKECDERVNVNFAPYRSQRAIAETRLRNVQNKIRQVEAEFDRRRCAMLPAPTLSSRIVQQFSRPCYSARFEDPRRLYSTIPPDVPRSPDPFTCMKPRSPKRLLLKPRACNPETSARTAPPVGVRSNPPNPPKTTVDDGSRAKETSTTSAQTAPERQSSNTDTCACCCDRTTSEESVDEAKKKLRPRIAQVDAAMMSNAEEPGSEAFLTSNVCVRIATERREMDMNVRKCGEWDETSGQGTPCDAKRCIAFVNVAGVESARILAESKSDMITLGGGIDGDVCESRNVTEISSIDRALAREGSASWPNLRRLEEEEMEAISKTDESTRDVENRDSRRGAPPSEVEQGVSTARTTARVADDTVLSAQEKPVDGTSSLQITLKSEKEKYEQKGERKEKENGETSPLIAGEAKAISKGKKKTRFQIVSLMRNIVYNKKHEYGNKREISNKITKSEGEMTDLDIEKLNKHSSTKNLLKSAAQDITKKSHPDSMFPERLDLSKLCVDRPCQTVLKLAEEDKKASTMLRTNVFPPFKHLRKFAIDNEKKQDDVGTRSGPITKIGIMIAKCSSHCNDVTEDTSGTLRNSTSDHHSFGYEESFVSEIFSLISNMVTFINKIFTLNGRLLRASDNAMLRKSLNTDILRKDAPMHDDPQVNLKDYDPLAGTLHYTLASKQATSQSKRDSRDTNLLSRISTGEGCGRIHKVRHSIIEDVESDARYLLIGTSTHNHDLTRNFGYPYKVQRNLLLVSRLKNSADSRDQPHPFSLVKRTRKETHKDDEAKHKKSIRMMEGRKASILKEREKFGISLEAIKAEGYDGNTSETKKRDNEFKEQFSRESSHDIIVSNASAAAQERRLIDNFIVNNERVTNVHDYFGLPLETEINANVYKFTKLQIYKKSTEHILFNI
ncbi:hypothetical protein X777_04793 [Ooceraea biroi]|uniref:Uncharacterized protein n=1 Tax=Ooceraea biroi TaxID=2015173 RepID=A0A026WJP2_OOCBI|nr:hypothetical protein X777_04793 [Ooceraea biroi]